MQRSIIIFLYCLTLMAASVHAQEARQSEREAIYYRYLEFRSYVKGGSIEPHWMADGSSFWYAEGATNMPTIEPSFHINQPGSESEVCGDSSQRLRPNGF